MLVRFSRPVLASRSQPYFRAFGFGGVTALILLIVASDPAVFVRPAGHRASGATFVAASFLAGWLIGAASGASPSDRFTLATEFATRNMAVATAIALTLATPRVCLIRDNLFPHRDSLDVVRDRCVPTMGQVAPIRIAN